MQYEQAGVATNNYKYALKQRCTENQNFFSPTLQ
jgi:hypothetical protein